MADCVLFIEGSRKTDNGDLRNGFGRLLRQANPRQMPLIMMCDDTDGAIRKFQLETANPKSAFRRVLVLVDLDGPKATRLLSGHRQLAFASWVMPFSNP